MQGQLKGVTQKGEKNLIELEESVSSAICVNSSVLGDTECFLSQRPRKVNTFECLEKGGVGKPTSRWGRREGKQKSSSMCHSCPSVPAMQSKGRP